jgi:hypothetical protein
MGPSWNSTAVLNKNRRIGLNIQCKIVLTIISKFYLKCCWIRELLFTISWNYFFTDLVTALLVRCGTNTPFFSQPPTQQLLFSFQLLARNLLSHRCRVDLWLPSHFQRRHWPSHSQPPATSLWLFLEELLHDWWSLGEGLSSVAAGGYFYC